MYQEAAFTSWGRVERRPQSVARPRYRDELAATLEARAGKPMLAVGLGRSYGDSILNSTGCLIDMTGLDRIIAFDAEAA